ncbi:hypothetical protein KC872_01270, partial [Candidatus Kaiserbacteria bacterium]|nr:hypothetical protein [Candidatus Kaiserbacteria bacterium]
MPSPSLKLIAIGYAKRALEAGSRERLRMGQYASVLSEYHVIVFTRESEKLPAFQQDGNLFLYGTNAKTRIGMMIEVVKIGRRITKQKQATPWIVSCQDPFETSLVGRLISCGRKAVNHVQIHGDVFNPI